MDDDHDVRQLQHHSRSTITNNVDVDEAAAQGQMKWILLGCLRSICHDEYQDLLLQLQADDRHSGLHFGTVRIVCGIIDGTVS